MYSVDITQLFCKDGRVCRVGFCLGHVEDEESSHTSRNKRYSKKAEDVVT